ncbi:MAG TPA: hypothetical protein VH813_02930 [Candidatus Limnocylindrales bacterium]
MIRPDPTTEPERVIDLQPVGGGRAPNAVRRLVLGACAILLVAVLKPWGAPTAEPAPAARATAAQPPSDERRTPPPTPSPASKVATDYCFEPGSWRVATVERWGEQVVRVWRAIEPVAATVPTDPGIPASPVFADSVPELGFCAPAVGPEQPSSPAVVTVWRIDGGEPSLFAVRQLRPRSGGPIEFGAMYAPEQARQPAATSWTDGRYVFRYRALGRAVTRWFAVDVHIIDLGASTARTAD